MYEDKIMERIEELREAVREEGDGEINQTSIDDFMGFQGLINKKPSISVCPDNNIYAIWIFEGYRYSFHFRKKGTGTFVRIKRLNEDNKS